MSSSKAREQYEMFMLAPGKMETYNIQLTVLLKENMQHIEWTCTPDLPDSALKKILKLALKTVKMGSRGQLQVLRSE